MQATTLLIAVLGVLLSALSLGWQAATFFLSGGRVKAELLVGGLNQSGGSVLGKAQTFTEHHVAQGFTQPIVAIQVRNVGRLPVTITDWSLRTLPGGVSFVPMADSIGPPLPQRLEAGETTTWAVDATKEHALRHATAATLKVPVEHIKVLGRVGTGDGRAVKARGKL